jgi:Domain of unknown function (DUF4157)
MRRIETMTTAASNHMLEPRATPPIVRQVLSTSGRPLGDGTRLGMEQRFRHSFADVKVHDDGLAAASAKAIHAAAYTSEKHIAFGAAGYEPESRAGRELLAHELMHVVQQSLHPNGPAVQCQTLPVVSREDFDKAVWANDWDKVFAYLNAAEMAEMLEALDSLQYSRLKALWKQKDKYATRANVERIGRARTVVTTLQLPPVSSDEDAAMESFLTAKMASKKSRLAVLGSVGKGPLSWKLGDIGAALTERKDLEHDVTLAESGKGVYKGNLSNDLSPTARKTDCTEFVLEVLRETFAMNGASEAWKRVEQKYGLLSYKHQKPGKLSGLDVAAALQSECDWKGIYWAANPRFNYPGEGGGHKQTYDEARQKGTYYGHHDESKEHPGVAIEKDKLVTDYRPAPKSTTAKNTYGLDNLSEVPFGVIVAGGGTHMALLVHGIVYEVHWEEACSANQVITATPLSTWGWLSGAFVAPAEDIDAAWKFELPWFFGRWPPR